MRILRAHCALTVVLAGAALTLTGCSDSPAANGPVANGTQPTQPSQPTQPVKSDDVPTDDESTPPADNGGSSDYCSVLEHSGDTFAKWQSAGSEAGNEREIIAKSFDNLAAKAPADIKPAMTDIATGYRLVSSGQVDESDQAQITKFATAIQTFNKWLPAHCPDLDLKVEGPAS
ncbi:hypothetical protein [Kribbella sp. NPDC006257]|uniref:hypothetical protein n=1 Tax=Kribbella sp. NPDC006257 TaxID=3156738 RepID=UPI0033B7CDC4